MGPMHTHCDIQQRTVAGTTIPVHQSGHWSRLDRKHKKAFVQKIAGKKWIDSTLVEWPENDHRIFVGNLSKDVTDDILAQHFVHYPSFAKARVVRDKYTQGPKGYGFVSFLEVTDLSRSLAEMEGTYIINRPCKLRRSNWDERTTALWKNGTFERRKKQFTKSDMECLDIYIEA